MATILFKDAVLIALVEMVSVLLIGHLWLRRKKVGVAAKCFWTVLLLLPAVGPLLYGLAGPTLSAHNDPDPGDHTGGWSPPGMEP
jgi:hypothetical protein